eukprot:gnl/MRDRNA2_/MRDRNA2_74857_c0_seq1.p1 gnl/MRDRNA2_/MRDRNA2_74857_c0~~gnl/MRDRNA2_/MRDRNA2_74857_c0_seq1.p1  ORF type:complete len:173 (+),score=15.10 gnl/MRDRNA2_/MRDRNA2_74857_c0_seq1:29-520(+)
MAGPPQADNAYRMLIRCQNTSDNPEYGGCQPQSPKLLVRRNARNTCKRSTGHCCVFHNLGRGGFPQTLPRHLDPQRDGSAYKMPTAVEHARDNLAHDDLHLQQSNAGVLQHSGNTCIVSIHVSPLILRLLRHASHLEPLIVAPSPNSNHYSTVTEIAHHDAYD